MPIKVAHYPLNQHGFRRYSSERVHFLPLFLTNKTQLSHTFKLESGSGSGSLVYKHTRLPINYQAQKLNEHFHNDIIIQSSAVSSQPLAGYLHKLWPTTAHALLDHSMFQAEKQHPRIISSSSSTAAETIAPSTMATAPRPPVNNKRKQ
ncbi:hypothetical protein FVEG_15950 [Fusarium verticillioides 7600]|uniref:Uncharacterized protein n=1 Tax=Gibberella moniliformis (strain M3125 / FGSC 7600) TaxID=334819 RepID=W7MF92_GIBM7|nr:hypothetical protein FVEG_15950 [Fusarium verticillioides 7600]EWG46334.1 hypothetical protein FVEG_15950 [Fusarium verticillioides 7600]